MISPTNLLGNLFVLAAVLAFGLWITMMLF